MSDRREAIIRKLVKLAAMTRAGTATAEEQMVAHARMRELLDKLADTDVERPQPVDEPPADPLRPVESRYRLRLTAPGEVEFFDAPPEVTDDWQAKNWAHAMVREWAKKPPPREALLLVERDGSGTWQHVGF